MNVQTYEPCGFGMHTVMESGSYVLTNEYRKLEAELDVARAVIAAKDQALEMMKDILRKNSWGPYNVRPVVALAEQALALTPASGDKEIIDQFQIETIRHAANAIFNQLSEAHACHGTEQGKKAILVAQRLADLIVQSKAAGAAINAARSEGKEELWLVWSNEHGAWWGPNESGYYTDIRSAGRYRKEKAMECADSRSHIKRKLPPEVIISERDAMAGIDPNAARPAGKEGNRP